MPSWKNDFLRLMAEAAVPGAAIAVIRDGRLDRHVNCGVRGVQMPVPVDENTVFDAASLSKPVFAYTVLQLVDRGELELDARLDDYLPNYIAADPRSRAVTVNHVLSHSAGLPNWRSADYPLRTYFLPTSASATPARVTSIFKGRSKLSRGETLPALAQRLVFEPLAMTRSSFNWQPQFDDNRAYPHELLARRRSATSQAKPTPLGRSRPAHRTSHDFLSRCSTGPD